MSEHRHLSTSELRDRCQQADIAFRLRGERHSLPCLELLRRAAGLGDGEAWEAFIAIYNPQIRRWVRRRLGQIQCSKVLEEDDFVNAVWMRAIAQFTPDSFLARQPWTMKQVMTYIMRVTLTTISRLCGKERRWSELTPYLGSESLERILAPHPVESPLPAGMSFEDVLDLLKDEEERLVLTYRYVYGWPPRKIAQHFSEMFPDTQAVQKVWNRVRKRLARQWRSHYEK